MKSILRALAEPNRLRMLEILRHYGPLSAQEIAKRVGLSVPQTIGHLHALCNAGLVSMLTIFNRPIYKVRPDPFREVNIRTETYRHLWEENSDRLEDYLQALQNEEASDDEPE